MLRRIPRYAIDWRPGTPQLLPMAGLLGPWGLAMAFTSARTHAALVLPVLLLIAAWAAWRFHTRPRLVTLHIHDDALLVDAVPWLLRGAWLAPGFLVLRATLPRDVPAGRRRRSRTFWIHVSEVDRVGFARLRRFVVSTLPQVTPRRAVGRRAGR